MVRNFAWLALAACGGVVEPGPDASISDASVADNLTVSIDVAPSCTIVDASNCKTGPTFVNCQNGGEGQWCVNTNCGDFADASCTIECTSSEYGAICGFGGDIPLDPPIPTCRMVGNLPSGTAAYCCPCE